jgi:hypothetical protein
MADQVYTGVIQDMGGAVYNLFAYGAVGDGKTDDTAAVNAAIAAVPDGGTLYIPTGTFRVTDTITIDRPISIEGSGSAAGLWLDLKDVTQTGLVIGNLAPVTGASHAQNQSYRNFGVFGATGSCRFGLGVYYCFRARFENVHVRPGSAENAVVVGGCLDCSFNFIVQNNNPTGYPPGSGTWNGAGILVADLETFSSTPSTMPTNACVFDCIVEGGSGGGLAFQQQPQQGGVNIITGTYEGFAAGGAPVYGAGYAVLIEGCNQFTLRDLYVEATPNGTLIKNSTNFTVRDSGFFSAGTALEMLSVVGCADFAIDRILVGELSIDPSCSQYQVQNVVGKNNPASAPATQDSFATMFQDPGFGGTIVTSGMARFTSENLVPNGDLSRWPLDFGYSGAQPALTPTGVGATDPTCRFNQNAVKVSATAQSTLIIAVPTYAQYVGQPVTVWADLMTVSGAGVSLGLYETTSGSFTTLASALPGPKPAWVRGAMTFYPTAGQTWAIGIQSIGTESFAYYLGGVGALVGVSAPMGAQSAVPSFPQGLQVQGKVIQYGAAAPTQGTWQPGDIVYNTAPAPGGSVGWVCTAAGSPGTWNAFGAIST